MRVVMVTLLAAVACGPSAGAPDAGGGAGADAAPGLPDAWTPVDPADAGLPCDKMDIVFIIDNSGSMEEEQENLALNYPDFIGVLEDYDSELEYRVALTSTGMDYTYQMTLPPPIGGTVPMSQDGGDNGALLQRCDMTGRWIERTDPAPAETFACAAQLGISGPSDEMPLAAMRAAFEDRIDDGTNAGFLRPDALLALVFLTDEDDCSYEQSVTLDYAESLCEVDTEPVASYVSFLDQLTGDRARWAVAVIAGETDCESVFGGAAEATRLKEFVALTGENAVMSSICEADLAGALAEALETFDTACENFPPIE
jgi:hypothetical protein